MSLRIDGFIWLEQYVEKLIVKHHVYPDEVEELFFHRPFIRRVRKGYVAGEDVYQALGQTDSDRYLLVIFIYKPVTHQVLVVSARDMADKERKGYERQ